MFILGVTGGVGAGKSEILLFLEREYRARVMRADEAAHVVMEPGGICHEEILRILGRDVLAPDGSLDRRAIAAKIFGSEELRQAVNGAVHPAVRLYISRDMEESRKAGCGLYVLEAALLLEENYDEICNEVWYIYADEQVRRKRLAASRGYTEEKTESIMKSQRSDAEFRARCRTVIDNSGSFEQTEEQIRRRLEELGTT